VNDEQKPDYTKLNLDQLRLEAGWSIAEFARIAGVDFKTMKRAVTGQPVQDTNAHKIIRTLNRRLDTRLDETKVPGLAIFHKEQKKREVAAA
jgi:transcriptional regulator with XRE-family HTH domain